MAMAEVDLLSLTGPAVGQGRWLSHPQPQEVAWLLSVGVGKQHSTDTRPGVDSAKSHVLEIRSEDGGQLQTAGAAGGRGQGGSVTCAWSTT